MKALPLFAAVAAFSCSAFAADQLLVEAESFKEPGGWVLDTQFIQIMGSPYLMAHGMGEPVKDATTSITLPGAGKYHVWVRTKDWVAKWKAPGAPGKFQVLVDGKPLGTTFGTVGADWNWQDGGTVDVTSPTPTIALHDLTGFNGRCDAIYFSKDATPPPADDKELPAWRMKTLGLPENPEDAGKFDLVVCGGGYGGMGAAISAARMGLKVALIQDRPVLGGNGSSEVRVWAMGGIRRGLYPQLGEIVEEFADKAKSSPGTKEEFGDDKKEAVVRGEKNISLFLNNHIISAQMADKAHLASVVALDTRTSEHRKFSGKLFCDATGHATVGAFAGADLTLKETGHMGMSNMWRWDNGTTPSAFPSVEWALALGLDDFPYPRRNHAEWFWESGFDIHPIYGLEETRDWNLRAIFGAWDAMKNKDGKSEHGNAKLQWIAYIGGTRESRQLLGDLVLTGEDITEKKAFPDGTVPTTWDIDLHYPKEQYAKGVAKENPFISKAIMEKKVDRASGYPVPYRCMYSKNIENLFMAGRDISVTHEALGTVRVMKTGGMIGEVVGKAASLCLKNEVTPRGVYERYLPELLELLKQPGAARRATIDGPITLPVGYVPPPLPVVVSKESGAMGIKPKDLDGLIVDDDQAKFTGTWSSGSGLTGYVGTGYHYRKGAGEGTAKYEFSVTKAGKYDVRLSNSPHDNRGTAVPVTIESADGKHKATIDQTAETKLKNFNSVGTYQFAPGKPAIVTIGGKDVKGLVHADAVQLVPVP